MKIEIILLGIFLWSVVGVEVFISKPEQWRDDLIKLQKDAFKKEEDQIWESTRERAEENSRNDEAIESGADKLKLAAELQDEMAQMFAKRKQMIDELNAELKLG